MGSRGPKRQNNVNKQDHLYWSDLEREIINLFPGMDRRSKIRNCILSAIPSTFPKTTESAYPILVDKKTEIKRLARCCQAIEQHLVDIGIPDSEILKLKDDVDRIVNPEYYIHGEWEEPPRQSGNTQPASQEV